MSDSGQERYNTYTYSIDQECSTEYMVEALYTMGLTR